MPWMQILPLNQQKKILDSFQWHFAYKLIGSWENFKWRDDRKMRNLKLWQYSRQKAKELLSTLKLPTHKAILFLMKRSKTVFRKRRAACSPLTPTLAHGSHSPTYCNLFRTTQSLQHFYSIYQTGSWRKSVISPWRSFTNFGLLEQWIPRRNSKFNCTSIIWTVLH